MRLATVRTPHGTRAARVDESELVLLDQPDVTAVLRSGAEWRESTQRTGRDRLALGVAELAPVVPHPAKILCVGLNYASHIAEMGREAPEYPTLFAKYARALIGPRDPIVLPAVSDMVDWEVELAVVIGREVRHADKPAARAAIAGYTILNDVSVRDWQSRTTQFLQGKTFERTTPLGPALVTLDDLADPDNLEVRCEVDGVLMQRGHTSDLLFSPVDLIRYVSTIVSLEPGDVIATGTPGGVGVSRTPPVFLRHGQTVRTTIEGLGELVNPCVDEAADQR